MKLEGKVAIIAGGGQGIGEGIVNCLAEDGADIAVIDIKSETAEKVTGKAKSMGRKTLPVVADLTDDNEVTRVVKDVVDHFGKVDILVNCVGGSSEETGQLMREYRESVDDDSLPMFMYNNPEIWDRFYNLNLKTHVMLSHAVTPYFIKQKSGKIVNISSDAGRLASPTQMPYGAMKAADISITWSLARALAPYNVTVNCVCPGFVYSPLWARGATAQFDAIREAQTKGEFPERWSRFANENLEGMTPYDYWMKYIVVPNTPMGREQTAEDMGKAVAFFVSEDAKNITGQVIHVDGGMVMR